MKTIACSTCSTNIWIQDDESDVGRRCSNCIRTQLLANQNRRDHEAEVRQENIDAMAARIYERAVSIHLAHHFTISVAGLFEMKSGARAAAEVLLASNDEKEG